MKRGQELPKGLLNPSSLFHLHQPEPGPGLPSSPAAPGNGDRLPTGLPSYPPSTQQPVSAENHNLLAPTSYSSKVALSSCLTYHVLLAHRPPGTPATLLLQSSMSLSPWDVHSQYFRILSRNQFTTSQHLLSLESWAQTSLPQGSLPMTWA